MEGRRYSGETEIVETRKGVEGRRCRGRYRDREDKKGMEGRIYSRRN
jgi:hypothetical protein